MKYRIVVLPSATADLMDIDIYLSQFGGTSFERLLTAIEKRAGTLCVFPESGRLFRARPKEIRVTFVNKFALFYQIEGNIIKIARVVDGQRDLTLLTI